MRETVVASKNKIGHFNPVAQGEEVMLHMDAERVQYWISKGAQASSKAAQLIKIFNKAQQSGEKAVMRSKPKKVKPMPEEVKTEAVAEDKAPEEVKAEPVAEEKATEEVKTEAVAEEKAPVDAKTETAAEEKPVESDKKDGDA